MLKGNKGEWSEIYAFCYLLSTGVLRAADKDLNPTAMFFPILKILREEIRGTVLNYFPAGSDWNAVKVYDGDVLLATVEKDDLDSVVSMLLDKIPEGERAFEIPEVNAFFDSIYVHKLKADSAHKQDIDIHIHDVRTGYDPICGFSIKSYLGSKPTLVNPGKGTNFVYVVEGCSEEIAVQTNSIDTRTKIKDRMKSLRDSGCEILCTETMQSAQFKENLEFIDSRMPEIISNVLLIAYREGIKKLSDAVDVLKEENPMGFSNTNMYEYKMKKLLCACALGMTPEHAWEGAEDANGGYIVVKKDGSVVCYHIYNRTDFEQYLYDYTCFDTPSTSRYEYMSVYEEDGVYKLKLNLQIRFV